MEASFERSRTLRRHTSANPTNDRRFTMVSRRIRIKLEKQCVDLEYLLDVFEVYCAVYCAHDRRDLVAQKTLYLWSNPDALDDYLDLESQDEDYLVRDALRALLGQILHAYDAAARIPFSKEALSRLQMWGLRMVATEDPKGAGRLGEARVLMDRDEAIVLVLDRIESLRLRAGDDKTVITREEACKLVASRLPRSKGGGTLRSSAVTKVWSRTRDRVLQSDPESRWARIETMVATIAEFVHQTDELHHVTGLWPTSILQMVRSLPYGGKHAGGGFIVDSSEDP